MSFPSYIKHLNNQPVVGFDGLNLLQYSFVPGLLDNLGAPVIVDTGDGKKRLVPPGPITLYNPMNPFEPPVTVSPGFNPLTSAMTPMSYTPLITRTINNSKYNVTITGTEDNVTKVVSLLESA